MANQHKSPIVDREIQDYFERDRLTGSSAQYIQEADLIVANRMTQDLDVVRNKVYTRDLYGKD